MKNPVIGYVFETDGKYKYKWMFEGTMKNIASFIMNHSESDTMITDIDDCFLVSSLRGGWLDRVCGDEFRKELLKVLAPMQNCETEPENLEFEQDGSYMMQKNVRDRTPVPDIFPQDCYPYEVPAGDRIYTCMAIISEEEGKSSAWYVDPIEEDGFTVSTDDGMWRGEDLMEVMDHSSIQYHPFWLNDPEKILLEPLSKESSELIYLDQDICEEIKVFSEYEGKSELLSGFNKILDYSNDGNCRDAGFGFGLD